MATVFRSARQDDAPALVHLQSIATSGMMADVWRRMGLSRGLDWQAMGIAEVSSETAFVSFRQTMVAEVDGTVAGLVNYQMLTDGLWRDLRKVEAEARPYAALMRLAGEALYVANIAVLPDQRRTGVAQTLLDVILRGAQTRNVGRIAAAVHEDNAASLALFRGRGFRSIASRAVLKHVALGKGTRILLLVRDSADRAAA